MNEQAKWRQVLVQEFDVPVDALINLDSTVRFAVRNAANKYLLFQCDFTRAAVLSALDVNDIPSSVVQLDRYRIGHLQFVAEAESKKMTEDLETERVEQQRQLGLAIEVLQTKFRLPSITKANPEKKEIRVGKYFFRYMISNDNVDWMIVDSTTGNWVKLFSGDDPRQLGVVLQQLEDQNDKTERETAIEAEKEADAPSWRDSPIYTEPDDGESERWKAGN